VREALRSGRRKHRRLMVARGVEPDQRLREIEQLARAANILIEQVPREQIEELAPIGHQGVLLQTSGYPYVERVDLKRLAGQRAIVLVLDGIEDPRNVGTLLRTAEATGVGLVVIPQNRAANITPAVVNASSGAVEHLNITLETNLVRWLDAARDAGFWAVGLAGESGTEPLFETDVVAPVALVVGSEGSGIRRLVREHCDMLVSIPMAGKIESLNASIAGSIALYEIYRDSDDPSQ
jgi:23S rRNA (guanosine2251-2'-O)-methyltransferase